jgi:hypothetical protein
MQPDQRLAYAASDAVRAQSPASANETDRIAQTSRSQKLNQLVQVRLALLTRSKTDGTELLQ